MRREVPDRILRAHLREMPLHRVLIRTIEARILAQVAFPRPILDVGCGDGHFASVLYPEGVDVGLDPGARDAAEAAARGVYRMVVRADSGAIPFPTGFFASVFSNCVFEHIPRIDDTIFEIGRVTRPGGIFACTVIGDRFPEFLTSERVWRRFGLSRARVAYLKSFNRKAVHHHFDPPEVWRRRFERAGFEVRQWRYYLSPRATRAFHRAHYVSLPHLVARRLTGRWVPLPMLMDRPFWWRWLARYVDEPEPSAGSCIAFVCVRNGSLGESSVRHPQS